MPFPRSLALLLIAHGVVTASAAHALIAAQVYPGVQRSHEALGALKVLRGARVSHKYVDVSAAPGETWTASAEGSFVGVSPTGTQTGPGRIRVTLQSRDLGGDGPFTGAVVVTPGTGEPVRVEVNVLVWPRAVQDLTDAQAKDRSYWISDPDFAGDWEKWGFLPDETSHPGSGAGTNVRTEEKVACTGGNTQNCTRAGQAGLAAGQSSDRAWQLSTGDARVMIAVLDSGIRWRQESLIEKAYLNAGELAACPPPGATASNPATFDVNGDGLFNVRDYDLQVPAFADLNGNGRLDAQDLIRGNHPATNGPCSDGVDDDGNGYTDDISGWDFFWNDNDASDDTDYGHGTGEARDSVAQGHDDTNDMGVCMGCTLLNVRVGDSFIADVNQFAEAVVFAVDSGASVVQEALGTVNNTPFAQAAIDYAWNHNVLVVASAADETSRHHNFPANGEHLINVHAVFYDTDGDLGRWRTATTFVNFNNCTNFGAHLDLSTPGAGCSSEATGKTSGQAGLLYSYYRQQQDGPDTYFDIPLTAAEARGLLIGSADDIDVTGAETDAAAKALGKFPSNEGWDEAFGYGRNNARRMMDMVRTKAIPPEVYIESPRWFEQFDPAHTPSVTVEGWYNARRHTNVSWTLELAKGVAPRDADFAEVSTGTGAGGDQKVPVTASVDITTLFADAQTPSRNIDERTLTVRLRVSGLTNGQTVHTEYRKAFSILRDPQRRRSLALFLGTSGEASPRMTDLDGDGRDELLLATSDGWVHAFRGDGTELPGWPVHLNTYPSFRDDICSSTDVRTRRKCHRGARGYSAGNIDPTRLFSTTLATASVGDLNGDGSPEKDVVITDLDGFLYAFNHAGAALPGFPVQMKPEHVSEFLDGKFQPSEWRFAELGFFAPPVLVDLDVDGDLEIVASGMDQYVYAWNHDASEVPGWPLKVANASVPVGPNGRFEERILASVTVAELDGDPTPELVVGTEELINNTSGAFVYALHAEGSTGPNGGFVQGWPVLVSGFVNEVLPYVGKGMPNTVAAVDLDADGKDEVVLAGLGSTVFKFTGGGFEATPVFSMNQGQDAFGPLNNTTEGLVACLINYPTVADLNLDGKPDVINGTAGLGLVGSAQNGGIRSDFQHSLTAWDLDNGYMLEGFPQVMEDFQFFMNYSVGDIDGDGKPEALAGSGVYMVHAFNAQGVQPEGWPKNTHGWVVGTPALGDLDGDDRMEVAASTREGWLFVWDVPGHVKKHPGDTVPPIQWGSYHHDERNTGNVRTALHNYGELTAPATESPSNDCACATAPLRAPALGWLLLGALVRMRRRGRA